MQKSTQRVELFQHHRAYPSAVTTAGVWGGLGLGSIPPGTIPTPWSCSGVCPSPSGAGLVALRCPPSVSPLSALLFPEPCLVQALYLFSFSMHTSGAPLRHKNNQNDSPQIKATSVRKHTEFSGKSTQMAVYFPPQHLSGLASAGSKGKSRGQLFPTCETWRSA